MNYKEYGVDNKDTIILLHGGGLLWWNYRKEAELLKEEYHLILPILDGHAESDKPFSSIEDNASEIIEFIDEKLGGKVLMIGGLSLGAQVLVEILSNRKNICDYALIESASVIPSKITNALIAPTFGCSYGLIKNKGFSKLQFDSLHMDKDYFEEYYHDTCMITKKDMISFLKANTAYSLKDELKSTSAKVSIVVGKKENKKMIQSAKTIHDNLPDSSLNIMPGLYHGEFSLNHPHEYAGMIKNIIGD